MELKGVAKVALAPGETKTVTLVLDRDALAYWNDAKQAWVAEAGTFEVLLGSSSRDMRARAMFRLAETVVFGGPSKRRRALSVNSTIRELLEDDDARAMLERHLPGFAANAQMGMAAGLSLIQVAGFGPEQITQERLAAIGADLATL